MPVSRRGSGSVVLPSGQTIAIHTRTQDEEDLPHATKKYVLVTHTRPIILLSCSRCNHMLISLPFFA